MNIASGQADSDLIKIPQIDLPHALREDMPDRFMLLPASGVVPFHHEQDDLVDRRIEWVFAGEQPIKLCLLAGPGGSGKTRLLIEVCRRLQADHGWQAGFLQPVDDVAQELRALLQHPQGSLIVIDYAETRAQDAVELVRLALKSDQRSPLRWVLLARNGGDWWNHLSEGAQNDVEAAAVLQGPSTQMGPYYLWNTDIALEKRQQLFHDALTAFAAKIGHESPAILTPDLSAECFHQILFIHLAALAALRGTTITDHKELLVSALRHERAYWRRAFERDGVDAHDLDGFEQIVALLTLIGGTQSAAETRDMIDLAPRLRDATLMIKNQMFDLLRPFTRSDGSANGLEPDLLGERLVADSLAKDAGLLDVAFRDPKHASARIRHAYTLLTRLARQDPDEKKWLSIALEKHLHQTVREAMAVAMETGPPMEEMLRTELQKSRKSGQQRLVNALRVNLPETTSNLVELAVDVAELHVSLIDVKGRKNHKVRLNAIDAYDMLAARYESLGRFNDVLTARQKAVEFARKLSKSGRDANPNARRLARAYRRLATAYEQMCHFSEALEASQQAERILRPLANVYRSDWAESLDHLGNHLSDLGRYEEALQQAHHAEQIYRELADAQPEIYRPDWARSLDHLGNHLSDLGLYEEALQQAHHAEHIFRELADAQPEVYRHRWAESLKNLGKHLSHLGQHEEALKQAHKAEHILRERVESQPGVYRREWARTLDTLGFAYTQAREADRAVPYHEQALAISREIGDRRG